MRLDANRCEVSNISQEDKRASDLGLEQRIRLDSNLCGSLITPKNMNDTDVDLEEGKRLDSSPCGLSISPKEGINF